MDGQTEVSSKRLQLQRKGQTVKRTIYSWAKWHWYVSRNNYGAHQNRGKHRDNKWEGAQRAQPAIMKSLTDTREFNKLKIIKGAPKYSPRRPSAHVKVPARQMCSYCDSSHAPRQCLAYGKKCADCSKISHFRGVCRSKRTTAVNDVEHETA